MSRPKNDELCIKARNLVSKTRNCVSKTRDFAFKMMDFAGAASARVRHRLVRRMTTRGPSKYCNANTAILQKSGLTARLEKVSSTRPPESIHHYFDHKITLRTNASLFRSSETASRPNYSKIHRSWDKTYRFRQLSGRFIQCDLYNVIYAM